jgi:2-polyprenyl-3-methyl-5-hydroxy-6-metoxy-1,4-benzoquinol methylase
MDQQPHFFDRYNRFLSSNAEAGPARNAARLHHRYQAIITHNFDLFRDARVLDILCADGCWSMAALDAGARHVVGVEVSRTAVEEAEEIFSEYYGIRTDVYQFIHSDVLPALRSMTPGAFDLILCQNGCELLDPRVLFGHFERLRPKHVILDTGIARGEGPVTRFTLKIRDESAPKGTDRYAAILATPNHEMITLLCEYFNFRWRLIAWDTMDIADWTGIHDYERDRRRTYVLDRL